MSGEQPRTILDIDTLAAMSSPGPTVYGDDSLFWRARRRAARSPAAFAAVDAVRQAGRRVRGAAHAVRSPDGQPPFEQLPPHAAVRMAYDVVLRRQPDPVGLATVIPRLADGLISNREAVQELLGSEEFSASSPFHLMSPSVHYGRCMFVRSLPEARRIIDLGGTHLDKAHGALVAMGYPYDFDELVIVDLPVEERHPLYQRQGAQHFVETPRGPVRYAYHSMADLSRYADASFDLVYSGQTFEHVTEREGDDVLQGALRVLRPGGHLAIDTPNGRVTRLQQEAFIDPDHEVEYDRATLLRKIERAGFEVCAVQGLNYAGPQATTFDEAVVARNAGIYAAAEDCYILTVVCRKPDPSAVRAD